MPSIDVATLDDMIGVAVATAAGELASRNALGERVLERDLEEQLQQGLRPVWSGAISAEGRKQKYPFPDWAPLPGGPDLVLYDGAVRRALIECKWSLDGDNVYEVLNDVFKLAAAYRWPGFSRSYMVVGAPARLWDRPTAGAEWFPHRPGQVSEAFDVVDLLSRRCCNWRDLRAHSAGVPSRTTQRLRAKSVAVVPISITSGAGVVEPWQLRCGTVEAVAGVEAIFDGWWPIGAEPCAACIAVGTSA